MNNLDLLLCADNESMASRESQTFSIWGTLHDWHWRKWAKVAVDDERSNDWRTVLQTNLFCYSDTQTSKYNTKHEKEL